MRALAALVLLLAAGCGAPVRTEEGRIVYKAQQKSAASKLTLTTREVEVRIAETPPDLSHPATEAEVTVTPQEMGELVAALEDDRFFELPGMKALPEKPAPRSISIDLKTRRFYVTFTDLRDRDEIDRYSRATRLLIGLSQVAGPHYESNPARER